MYDAYKLKRNIIKASFIDNILSPSIWWWRSSLKCLFFVINITSNIKILKKNSILWIDFIVKSCLADISENQNCHVWHQNSQGYLYQNLNNSSNHHLNLFPFKYRYVYCFPVNFSRAYGYSEDFSPLLKIIIKTFTLIHKVFKHLLNYKNVMNFLRVRNTSWTYKVHMWRRTNNWHRNSV